MEVIGCSASAARRISPRRNCTMTNSATSLLMISAKIRSGGPDLLIPTFVCNQPGQNIGADILLIRSQRTFGTPPLHGRQARAGMHSRYLGVRCDLFYLPSKMPSGL
jgi:hypothetical protein